VLSHWINQQGGLLSASTSLIIFLGLVDLLLSSHGGLFNKSQFLFHSHSFFPLGTVIDIYFLMLKLLWYSKAIWDKSWVMSQPLRLSQGNHHCFGISWCIISPYQGCCYMCNGSRYQTTTTPSYLLLQYISRMQLHKGSWQLAKASILKLAWHLNRLEIASSSKFL